MDPRREYQLGLFFVIASAITWSSAGFFTRLIGLDYPTMIAGRGIFGALGLIIVIIAVNGRKWPRLFMTMGRNEATYVALVVLGMIAFVGSLGLTSVAHNSVIFATLPLIAAFLAWVFLKELPSAHALVAAVFAIFGVGIMAGFGLDGGLSGDILSLLATLCMALCIIIIRKNPMISVTACACIGSFMSGALCLPFADLGAIDGTHLIYLILFGLLNSAAGLTLFSLGSKRLPPIETALISTLDTPLAPLWVWLAFNEAAGPQTLLGGIIVLSAVLLHVVMSQRRQAKAVA
jgi:drug/metabolite transporter (DMT)-like permease